MNDRIEKLAGQSWNYAYDLDYIKGKVAVDGFIDKNFWDEYNKKFANLIIEECIKLVGPTPDHRLESDYYLGGREGIELLDNVVETIKKHFGIEDE